MNQEFEIIWTGANDGRDGDLLNQVWDADEPIDPPRESIASRVSHYLQFMQRWKSASEVAEEIGTPVNATRVALGYLADHGRIDRAWIAIRGMRIRKYRWREHS